jgi:porphobilinogen deaminase
MHFWAPQIDPAHPLECTQAERYVLQRLSNGCYVSIEAMDQSLVDVSDPASAYLFHTHEAALRAAGELNRLGGDGFDVVKIE